MLSKVFPYRGTVTLYAILSPLFMGTASAQSGSDEELIVRGIYDAAQSVLNISGSVDVLDTTELETILLVHPAEALNGVAGVNIQRGSGQEHLTAIRSPVLTGGAGAGSFLYLQDGVPLRAAGFANVNGLFESGIEFAGSAEVFKGPGPALYGSNAVHGLVNVQSRSVEGPNRFQVLASEDGLISGQLSARLQDNLRASVSLVSDNGFRDDSGFDQQKFEFKYETDLGAWTVDGLAAFNNLNQETAGFIEGDDAYLDDDIRFTNPNPEAFRDGKSYRAQLRFERELGGKILALTPYARRAELEFLRHFVPGQALEKNHHSSIGLQTAWFDESLNVGADIEYTEGSLFEVQENETVFSFAQGLHYDYEVDSFVGAIYAQKDIFLGDRTRLDIGARAEYTRYDYDNQTTVGTLGRFIRLADRVDDFFVITPKANLRHEINENFNVYVRAARGARAPQTVDLYSVQLNQTGGEAEVETLDNIEAGTKFENNDVGFELTAYSQWKDNFFFRNSDGFSVANGKTKHIGIEGSFTANITNWLRLSGDGTLARHTYNFDDPNFNFDGSLDSSNTITDGDRVDTAPDTLAHMRVTLLPLPNVSSEIEWRHVGEYFTNPGNTNSYPGHDIFVLRSRYDLSDALSIFGRVDNLFDKRIADRADFAFGNERFFPGRPRTLFFGLSSEF